MKPNDLVALVLAALAMELHEMEQGDITDERLTRAQIYVDWLRLRAEQ